MEFILSALIIFAIILLIKNCVTYKHVSKLTDAIHKYNLQELKNSFNENRPTNLIPYSCQKSYDVVLFNMFDWSNKNIIPVEYYERIKPYL